MRKISVISIFLCICIFAATALSGCNIIKKSANDPTVAVSGSTATADSATADSATADSAAAGIDYMVLVNKTHALPDDWEEKLVTVNMTNSVGDKVEVEKKAYDAYLELKAELEAEGIFVDLDSARRSVADQQRIMDEFTEQYGAEYAAKTVAAPGFSEHHTGLALDLYLIIDGKDVVENEDMMQYPEIWEKIHAKLADHGFILRYLEGKEHITGYGYEPWHIRYLDNPDTAKEITSKGVAFEEYLGTAVDAGVNIDFGDSVFYTKEELEAAVIRIKCEFASFSGCELHSIRYAGDDAIDSEALEWLNELDTDTLYTQAAMFLMDFHSPVNGEVTPFEPDTEYKDYEWWLAKDEDGGWEILTFGNS